MKKASFGLIMALLLTSMAGAVSNSRMESSSALPSSYPLVYVHPESVTADVGQNFTISVIVYNLTDAYAPDPDNPLSDIPLGNLYGFDVQFTWDPSVIKYVSHTPTVPIERYPDPIAPSPYSGILHGYGAGNQSIFESRNIINENGSIPGTVDPSVRAWFAYVTLYPATPFNGNGTTFTMTFEVLKKGASPLDIVSATLSDNEGVPIGQGFGSGKWLNSPRDGMFRLGAPVADFTYFPSLGVENKTMYFNASVSENITAIDRYTWDFGDGTKMNTTVPTAEHNFTTQSVYDVSLKVAEVSGVESATVTHQVIIAESRDLEARFINLSNNATKSNKLVNITAAVKNAGTFDYLNETATLTVCYNTSEVNWGDLGGTAWFELGTAQAEVTFEKGVTFTLNSSSLPVIDAYYYFLLNVTGIPQGYEANTANNLKISEPLLYTNTMVHKPVIKELNLGYYELGLWKRHLIEGENTSIYVKLENSGNDYDTFNVTLYSNSSAVETWQSSYLAPGQTETIEREYIFGFGYYNLTVEAEAGASTDSAQSWIRVVKPPSLVIEQNPISPNVEQEVTFNASASTHQDPEGTITYYRWKIYAPGVDPHVGSPDAVFNGDNLTMIGYTFNETGDWTVTLEVTDNFDLTYDPFRQASGVYMITVTAIVIPEFSSILLILSMMALSTFAVAFQKKRNRVKRSQ